jgi:outer membrane protein OmpA-like peptidoglycan-associated protein
MKIGSSTLASATAAMLIASTAATTAQAAEKEWEFEVTPYLWGAGIDADAVVNGQPVRVDASFSDILDVMEFGGGLLMRAERNHWVLWTQFDYIATSTDKLDNPPENGSLDVDTTMVTAGFGRNFESSNGRRSVDVLLGARYLSLENTLQFATLGTFSRDRSYTDPVIIVRPSFQLSERWRFNPTFSFGSGGDSETTYELQPQIQFQMSEHAALRFGYRKLYYEIENISTGNSFDGSFQGPFIGIGMTFGGEPEPPPPPPPPPAEPAKPTPPPSPPPPPPKDTDRDRVVDGKDQCPQTPAGHRVDSVGCSFDTRLEVYFDTDSATLKPESYADLDRLVDVLKRVPTIRGAIEGHTDSTGSDAHNQSLSERRAAEVLDYLVEHGADRSRFESKGFGEAQPIASNDTAEGRSQNRRVILRRTDSGT